MADRDGCVIIGGSLELSKESMPASAVHARIESLLAEHPVVLFMKGTPQAPQCGFSASTAERLNDLLDDYASVDVLADAEIREGIKSFGDWPTIPQLYVRGELIGGADIVQSMFDSGQLHEVLGVPAPDRSAPDISVSEAAATAIRKALGDDSENSLFLVIDGRFNPQFQLREASGNEIIAESNGLQVHFDLSSAQRARGAVIDWVVGPQGEGLSIHLPLALPPINRMDVATLKTRLDAGDITVIDVRPEHERERAPFPGARIFTPETHAELTALPTHTPLAFLCHYGESSYNAAEHFRERGFSDLHNIEGGIEAWSMEIDANVPRY